MNLDIFRLPALLKAPMNSAMSVCVSICQYLTNIYLFKINNRNTRKRSEVC